MRLIPIMLITLALAGCAAQEPDPGSSSSTASTPPAIPMPSIHLAGCQGFHGFFPSPAQLFQELVPEGFTLEEEGPGTVEVPVFGFDCNGTMEIWALLKVVPPQQWANDTFDVDAVVLQGLTTNATLHAQYLDWGFDPIRVRAATGQESDYLGADVARDDRIALAAGDLRYEVRMTVQESQAPFDAASYRYWATNGTVAVGWLEVQAAPSTGIGAGAAVFQSEGDPGAPPAATGTGHRVQDAALSIAWHSVPAAAKA